MKKSVIFILMLVALAVMAYASLSYSKMKNARSIRNEKRMEKTKPLGFIPSFHW